jgi:hypothetical protein
LYGSKQPSADHGGRQSVKAKDKDGNAVWAKSGEGPSRSEKVGKPGIWRSLYWGLWHAGSSTMSEIQEFNFINALGWRQLR